MKIIEGLKNGAVLQRNSQNLCEAYFTAEAFGNIKTNIGKITEIETSRYKLSDIPAGGPYDVLLSDESDSVILSLLVGDLWILAGQSNMEGAGCPDSEDAEYEKLPNSNIRCYRSNGFWDTALPILHEPWLSDEPCIRDVWKNNQLASRWHSDVPPHISHNVPKRGVGPGLFFAKEMYKKTGVPQGVVPCALGGSSLCDWLKTDKKEKNLYGAMLRRFINTGSNVRGVLWSQGENETGSDKDLELYFKHMERLTADLRKDFNNNELPFVMAQTANTDIPSVCNDFSALSRWDKLRENQRSFALNNKLTELISTVDCPMDDLIHLSSAAQKIVGKRMAEAMSCLCGIEGNAPPRLLKARIISDEYRPFFAVLELSFSGLMNFKPELKPSGFSITKAENEQNSNSFCGIAKISLAHNTVKIYTEYSAEELENYFIKYGGNGDFCNIIAENGHGIPAFGPLEIKKLI